MGTLEMVRGYSTIDKNLPLISFYDSTGTRVQGWQNADVPAQKWTLRRVSRTGQEINNLVRLNPYTGAGFNSYLQDGLYVFLPLPWFSFTLHLYSHRYIVPPASVRNEIYSTTGLSNTGWRSEIFDCR
jgi:hypothetical protein